MINGYNHSPMYLLSTIYQLLKDKHHLLVNVCRLHAVFPSRFPTVESASSFDTPEKIANKIYGGRMGNLQDGDGWKYHGRGLIQLTGRDNYKSFSDATGIDAINHPELLLQPEYACLSAGWFWNKRTLNMTADTSDYKTMTQRINGGLLGLDDRIARFKV